MKTVALFVGTRPEAIKMAPVFRAVERVPSLRPLLVATGQHEIERILARQLSYEGRIGELSLRLVESDVDAIEQVIREGLAEVAELAEVDRAVGGVVEVVGGQRERAESEPPKSVVSSS